MRSCVPGELPPTSAAIFFAFAGGTAACTSFFAVALSFVLCTRFWPGFSFVTFVGVGLRAAVAC